MKVVERLLISLLDSGEVLRVSFVALLDAFNRLKEVQEGNEEAEVSDEEGSEDGDDDEDDSDEVNPIILNILLFFCLF